MWQACPSSWRVWRSRGQIAESSFSSKLVTCRPTRVCCLRTDLDSIPCKERSQGKELAKAALSSADPNTQLSALLDEYPDDRFILMAAAEYARDSNDGTRARGYFERASKLPHIAGEALQKWGAWEHKCGNMEDARVLLQQAITSTKNVASACNMLATIEEESGNFGQAEKWLVKALDKCHDNVRSLQQLAVLHAKQGHHNRAQKAFEQASKAAPHDAAIWQAWGEFHSKRGSFELARHTFQRGADLADRSDSTARHKLSRLYCSWARVEAKRRNTAHARKLFNEALLLEPSDAYAIVGLGQLEARSGNTTLANEIYCRGLELQPTNVYLLSSLAHLYTQISDWDAAKQTWHRVLAVDTTNGYAWSALGTVHRREGELREAQGCFMKGIGGRFDTGSALCREALAHLYEFQGDTKAARETFALGCPGGTSTSNARLLREWAAFEKRQGDLSTAAQLYRKAADVCPVDERTWMQWGLLERRRGNPDGAIACFKAGVLASPKNASLWQLLGATLSGMNKMEEARAAFQAGTRNCPLSGPVRLEWALAEKAVGNREVALDILRIGQEKAMPHLPLLSAWEEVAIELGEESDAALARSKVIELERTSTKENTAYKKKLKRKKQKFKKYYEPF